MFNNLKKKIIAICWRYLSLIDRVAFVFQKALNLLDYIRTFTLDVRVYLKRLTILVLAPFLNFFKEIYLFFQRKAAYVWLFITKHRLLYVGRIILILFILYKPTLVDLDSIYWLASTVFYFISNTILFIVGSIVPVTVWFSKNCSYKFFIVGSLLPALWTARRLKRRLFRHFRFVIHDSELIAIFYWIPQLFVLSIYYTIFFSMFFLLTVLLPVIYVYLVDFDFITTTKLFYHYYFSSYIVFSLISTYFASLTYLNLFISSFYYIILYFYTIFINPYSQYLIFYTYTCWLFLKAFCFSSIIWFLAVLCAYMQSTVSLILDFVTLLSVFAKLFSFTLSWQNINNCVDIGKNFLFSDNYLYFIFLIIVDIIEKLGPMLANLIIFFVGLLKSVLVLFVGKSTIEAVVLNLTIIKSMFLLYFYGKLIILLNTFIWFNDLYLKDLTFFGLLSTWYEYLNQTLHHGVSKHRFINWLLLHLYASILAFWILDFDFRVSVKTPPKTPYTLLKEAKKTYDWIPPDMDLNALQTTHTKVYFALLDISFEHIESIQFIYGDYEHIDEEFDEEDDTPDEEEFWVDSDETVKVRDIIDSDLGATKLKTYWTKTELINFNPVSSYTGYERHFLTEIVGEPEIVNIEEDLKWAYEPLYSPSFEELYYKDSLFSEWVFDPEEDLTVFEVLLLLPLLVFFIYIWFYHRPLKRRHNSKNYYKAMVAVRRRIFSGFFIEDFLGIPLGDRVRRWIDAYRRYRAPETRIKHWYKYKLYRTRQKFKVFQLEAYFFERMRLKVFRKTLKQWEYGLKVSTEFLSPRRRLPQFFGGVRQIKLELRTWVRLGDWVKFNLYGGDNAHKRHYLRFEDLQMIVPELFEQLMSSGTRWRKRKRRIWKTLNALPGHITMARIPKPWAGRFHNKDIFYPEPHRKMHYSYNYYNYLGWRENRAQWRRYAFTPATFTDEIWRYHRGFYWRSYTSLRNQQRKHRLMRSLQF